MNSFWFWVACLHAAVTKSRQQGNRNRPRVGMLAQASAVRHVSLATNMPTRGRLGFSRLRQVFDGRVKACHPRNFSER